MPATEGRMQSRFRLATLPLAGTETVDLIQGGKNRRTPLTSFLVAALTRSSHIDGGNPFDPLEDSIDGGTP